MIKKIVFDPGHGGSGNNGDPGAVNGNIKEKDITLTVVQKVINKLSDYDLVNLTTRVDDTYVSLSGRAEFANNHKADFFLSIHCNSHDNKDAHGFESFRHPNASSLTEGYQNLIHIEVAKTMNQYNIFDRGQKKANLAVLRETKMPAVLLELAFLSNDREAKFLTNDKFLEDVAQGIVNGLVRAFSLVKKQPTWDPQLEVQKLIERGIINTPRSHANLVTWGEFAAVLNRILGGK